MVQYYQIQNLNNIYRNYQGKNYRFRKCIQLTSSKIENYRNSNKTVKYSLELCQYKCQFKGSLQSLKNKFGVYDIMEWLKEDPVKWYVMESAVINVKVDIFCSK